MTACFFSARLRQTMTAALRLLSAVSVDGVEDAAVVADRPEGDHRGAGLRARARE